MRPETSRRWKRDGRSAAPSAASSRGPATASAAARAAAEIDGGRLAEEGEPGARLGALAAAADAHVGAVGARGGALEEAVVGGVARAEGARPARGRAGELPERRRVVGAGDRHPALAERREELPLLARDVAAGAAHALGVRDADVREDGHVGLDDRRQRRDLAAHAHPHLEDREAVVREEAEGDGGDADAVVQVARRRVAGAGRLEQRGAQLFGGGLSGAPGDRDDARAVPAAPPRAQVRPREVAPRDERVVDLDDVRRSRGERRAPAASLDDDELGPRLDRGLEVLVPVVPLAAQGDERASARDGAAVARDAARGGALAADERDPAAGRRRRGPGGELRRVRRDGRGHQSVPRSSQDAFASTSCRPARRASRARRASIRSSNGCLTMPRI